MNKWSIGLSVAIVAALGTSACKKSDALASGDGGADGGAASAAVTNESDVTRYPYETKLASVAATIVRDTGTSPHRSPPDGPVITTLPKGAAVTEIAQANHAVLATFVDPADGKTKMGWITDDAFTSTAAPDAGPGLAGHGHAIGHDGGISVSGASAIGSAAAVVGGAVVPSNVPGPISVPPTNGQCPSGFTKGAHDPNCHKSCAATHDCPAGQCKNKICTIG